MSVKVLQSAVNTIIYTDVHYLVLLRGAGLYWTCLLLNFAT